MASMQDVREVIDSLTDAYGVAVIKGDNDKESINIIAEHILATPHLGREEIAVMLAFAVRRLWNKRSSHTKFSVN